MTPEPQPKLSYLGIGSCIAWLAGTAFIAWAYFTSDPDGVKLTGLAVGVSVLASVPIYLTGLVMAYHGSADAQRNPGSWLGLWLNGPPVAVLLLRIAIAVMA